MTGLFEEVTVVILYRRRVCLSTAFFLAASLVWAASASASCDPGRTQLSAVNNFDNSGNNLGPWFDGWQTGPVNGTACLNGSEANIFNKDPFVYTDAYDDRTFVFVMLLNQSSNGYAQVGWTKKANGSNRNNFTEVNTAETGWNFSRKLYSASAVGAAPDYKVTFLADGAGNTWFHFFIDGGDYRDFASSTYTGCDTVQAGEIHNRDSQMPGAVSGHDPFTNTQVRGSTGWFSTSTWGINQGDVDGLPHGAFGQADDGISTIQIWDTGCA